MWSAQFSFLHRQRLLPMMLGKRWNTGSVFLTPLLELIMRLRQSLAHPLTSSRQLYAMHPVSRSMPDSGYTPFLWRLTVIVYRRSRGIRDAE